MSDNGNEWTDEGAYPDAEALASLLEERGLAVGGSEQEQRARLIADETAHAQAEQRAAEDNQ